MLLLRTLDRNEVVQRFLDMYSAQFRRPGRADQPWHYREQLDTIRREAILAMVLHIEGSLPKKLNVQVHVNASRSKPKKGTKKGKKTAKKRKTAAPGLKLAIPLLDLFREEFFVALGQSLEWDNEDAQEFWRDLELYETLTAAARKPVRKIAGRSQSTPAGGPFVDRVGFLLDPSLMEQARREAGKFQAELDRIADQVLRKAFSPRPN